MITCDACQFSIPVTWPCMTRVDNYPYSQDLPDVRQVSRTQHSDHH